MTTEKKKPEPRQSLALVPQSLGELHKLSEHLSNAKTLSNELKRSPADVMLTIATGMELGIHPMTALRGIHIVEGKPTLSADLMVAICRGRPDVCEDFRLIESTDEIATYEAKRVGGPPLRMSFTIEDAKRAGKYPGKDSSNWARYTADMLRARAKSRLARELFGDLLSGCYTPDELDRDDAPPATAPPPVTVRLGSEFAEGDRREAQARTAEGVEEAKEAEPEDAEIVEEEPGGDDDEGANWEAEIRAAADLDELASLITAIKDADISAEELKAARLAYAERRKELSE